MRARTPQSDESGAGAASGSAVRRDIDRRVSEGPSAYLVPDVPEGVLDGAVALGVVLGMVALGVVPGIDDEPGLVDPDVLPGLVEPGLPEVPVSLQATAPATVKQARAIKPVVLRIRIVCSSWGGWGIPTYGPMCRTARQPSCRTSTDPGRRIACRRAVSPAAMDRSPVRCMTGDPA